MNKTELRQLMAIISGRESAAKQRVADLEAQMNAIKHALERARDELEQAANATKQAELLIYRAIDNQQYGE